MQIFVRFLAITTIYKAHVLLPLFIKLVFFCGFMLIYFFIVLYCWQVNFFPFY